MTPVEIALWVVESNLQGVASLSQIAAWTGVSRFHLAHAFGRTTGVSLMRYARGRRLSVAARALAGGAKDILGVALDTGYGSHEAFTRAFREQFGVTPAMVRARGCLDGVQLVERLMVDETRNVDVAAPRFEDGREMLIAGLQERYSFETARGIPALWKRFVGHIGHMPGQVERVAYGVCHGFGAGGHFDYLCGVKVADSSGLTAEFARVRLAARRYAVFVHAGHVSGLPGTVQSIWNRYLPASKIAVADAPNFERYGREFDGQTGLGGVEIWIPMKG